MIKQNNGLNCRTHQVEEHISPGDVPVHNLEQVIENDRQRYVGQAGDNLGYETQPVPCLMSQNVCRCRRSIARHKQDGANEDDREYACDYVDQVKAAADSGLQTRRYLCIPVGQYSCVHCPSSLRESKPWAAFRAI